MIDYLEGFDYGGEVAEKPEAYKLWPTSGTRTALVDADLLPYRVGFTVDDVQYLLAKQAVEEGEVDCIEDTRQYKDAFDQLCSTLNVWVNTTKCDSARLFSTKSDDNFRLNIAYTDEYKGQRIKEKPPFFSELKDAMSEHLGCHLAVGNEADDELSIAAWEPYFSELEEAGIEPGSPQHKEFCNTVTISSDKDSAITPTWHYNPDTRKMQWVTLMGELLPKYKNAMVNNYEYIPIGGYYTRGPKAGQPKTKRVLVGKKPSEALTDLKGSGLRFFYAQVIMGDTADNYKGLKGKGMTFAYNLLNNCNSERELYYAVLNAYKEVYGTGEHWCPNYLGTEEYRERYEERYGVTPPDWDFWKGKGAYLTAYDRMLEQGRLAWMSTKRGEIWREGKGRVIDPFDKSFWVDYSPKEDN